MPKFNTSQGAKLKWQNWAGNVSFTPKKLHKPRTEDEIREIVRTARAEGSYVRVVGVGHSFNDMNASEGAHALSMFWYKKVLSIDKADMTVTCQAGINLVMLLVRIIYTCLHPSIS